MTNTVQAAPLDHMTEVAARAMEAAAAADAAQCNERCIDATGPDCTCSCGGVNHGLRRQAAGAAIYARVLAIVGGDPFALLPTVADDDEWVRPTGRRIVVVDEGAF